MSHPTMLRLFEGGTVVCLATGPSLTSADVDYCRGKAGVIAINDAVRLAPWADILYSSDRKWWQHYKGVPKFNGLRYSIGSAPNKRNPYPTLPAIRVLKNAGYDGIATDPSELKNGRNSGYAALNLAVHTGASQVLLLGYNMSRSGGKHHYFGDHPPGLSQNASLFPGWIRLFGSMVEPLKRLGVDVINCTENTSLTCFPCAALRDVLRPVAHKVPA